LAKILKPFEDPGLVRGLADRLAAMERKKDSYTFMEVCGTHTHTIGRWALRSLIPDYVRLVSGPGCPVCVTPGEYIDNACLLACEKDVIIATYGDLVRVPGVNTSLENARSEGGDVRVVGSAFDALSLAGSTEKEVVFLAIGFETTIAGIGATVKVAHERNISNLSFYASMRLVPPALVALAEDPEVKLDGFVLPGHVSAIIGLVPYLFLADMGLPGMIVGFEPVDVLRGVEALMECVNSGEPAVKNLYPRVVRDEGNPSALAIFEEIFETVDAVWRGIGTIPRSGCGLKEKYRRLDAEARFELGPLSGDIPKGCRCGQVLKGIIMPDECPLFGKTCVPSHPVGPCMVSGEGSCAAHYKYQTPGQTPGV